MTSEVNVTNYSFFPTRYQNFPTRSRNFPNENPPRDGPGMKNESYVTKIENGPKLLEVLKYKSRIRNVRVLKTNLLQFYLIYTTNILTGRKRKRSSKWPVELPNACFTSKKGEFLTLFQWYWVRSQGEILNSPRTCFLTYVPPIHHEISSVYQPLSHRSAPWNRWWWLLRFDTPAYSSDDVFFYWYFRILLADRSSKNS